MERGITISWKRDVGCSVVLRLGSGFHYLSQKVCHCKVVRTVGSSRRRRRSGEAGNSPRDMLFLGNLKGRDCDWDRL